MQRLLYFLILFQFSANIIQAQDLEFDENCILFQDRKTGTPVLILEDSILYSGNPLTKKKYNHTPYPDRLNHYVSYSIKGRNFLVQDGSGPVLEFRNDSIVRLNKISIFQNQYTSAKFVYKNALHLFGGYGLFTFKNIVTKYDAPNKDWVQVQTFGDEMPSPRSHFYSYVVNENLYVFGGFEDNLSNILAPIKCDNTVWRLNIPTMKWHNMGKFDMSMLDQHTFLTFPANNKLYLVAITAYGMVFEVDIENNTIKKFVPKTLIKPTKIYFDNIKKELVCVTWISNGKYKIFQANLETFLGKPVVESAFIIPFYKDISTAYIGIGIGILFIVIGITIFLRKKKKNSLLPFNGIVYKKDTGNCYYKNKLIENLEEPELRILLYLIENAVRFVPLNELNRLFENGNNAENFSSIVKRREITLATLLQKLSGLTKLPETELLINRKNPEDKRIKEIRIAPSFLRIK